MPEIVNSAPVNQATPKAVGTRSNFNLSYPFMQGHRFGEYSPHFFAEGVPDDKNFRLSSAHVLRTTSLKAPLMNDVQMKKDYFKVNLRAILPKNWEKVYVNPIIGDDVDPEKVNCVVKNAPETFYQIMYRLRSAITASVSASDPIETQWSHCFRYLLTGELFYSHGSLLATCGINLGLLCKFDAGNLGLGRDQSYDHFFNEQIKRFVSVCFNNYDRYFTMTSDGITYDVYGSIEDPNFERRRYTGNTCITFNEALVIMRENMDFEITGFDTYNSMKSKSDIYDAGWFDPGTYLRFDLPEFPINLQRPLAYQLSCAHYFTNDKVDYIYSAELYRQLAGYYLRGLLSGNSVTNNERFQYNGVWYDYDWLAGYWWQMIYNNVSGYSNAEIQAYLLPFLRLTLQFNRSLRYMDYFTGARTSPLAVGNVNVAVSGNQVSIIEVTERTMAQKFLNAVNRGRRQLGEYIENLFPGAHVQQDAHDPQWLGHTTDVIFGVETENTGADQLTEPNSITTVLRGNAERFGFELDINEPCVLIGVTYYDIARCYTNNIERQNFQVDRFDMFNPFMQFIGDQPVYEAEKNGDRGLNDYFGYQLRHMEYKIRYPMAVGPLALPQLENWIFKEDLQPQPTQSRIDSMYIRSFQTELDRYFIALDGYSLGTYYHFIVKNTNKSSANRPMAFAPSIL